jgi:hypothetical protein
VLVLKVIRVEEGSKPGILLRISHPPIPGGKPAHQERLRLRFEQEVQLVELPDLKRVSQADNRGAAGASDDGTERINRRARPGSRVAGRPASIGLGAHVR